MSVRHCSKSLTRLTAAIDSHGLKWIKEQASLAGKGNGENSWAAFLEKGKAFLCPPTPYLERCLSTCGLLESDTLKATEVGPKFKDLLGVMPDYATVSSVNKPLLQEISPESVELCSVFTAQVEEKLAEHIASYKGTVKQLTRMNDKYKPLGEIFLMPKFQTKKHRNEMSQDDDATMRMMMMMMVMLMLMMMRRMMVMVMVMMMRMMRMMMMMMTLTMTL